MKKACYVIVFLLTLSCGTRHQITDKPITFDAERTQLTKEYMKTRYGIEADSISITPKMIVLHWTEIPSLEQSYQTFFPSTLPNRPDIATASKLNVSSHFLVDQDGTIYRLMPETLMARHVIGLNHTAIGIENVGGTDDMPLTKAQIKANIWLVNYLSDKYPIDYLIGHYEYQQFQNHPFWLEQDTGYRTEKVDPGIDFMTAVRKKTKNLHFKTF